jgi:hypothetical protein
MLQSMSDDPGAFEARLFTIMPRVFFAMLPIFAAVVSLFFRRRKFPTALVFAVHLHAFAFVIFSVGELAKFFGSDTVARVAGLVVVIVFTVYALSAFKNVFGGGWPAIAAKAIGIAFVYLLVSIPAFFIILIAASLV